VTACRCGHGAHAHEHYRRGSECALCACAGFRTTHASRLTRLLGRRRVGRGQSHTVDRWEDVVDGPPSPV
jgi:hypothetical protein